MIDLQSAAVVCTLLHSFWRIIPQPSLSILSV